MEFKRQKNLLKTGENNPVYYSQGKLKKKKILLMIMHTVYIINNTIMHVIRILPSLHLRSAVYTRDTCGKRS